MEVQSRLSTLVHCCHFSSDDSSEDEETGHNKTRLKKTYRTAADEDKNWQFTSNTSDDSSEYEKTKHNNRRLQSYRTVADEDEDWQCENNGKHKSKVSFYLNMQTQYVLVFFY